MVGTNATTKRKTEKKQKLLIRDEDARALVITTEPVVPEPAKETFEELEEYEYPSEDELEQETEFDKYRIIGITERELKRRKRQAQTNDIREPTSSFFRQAFLEFQKIKKQRKHQKNIQAFQQRIELLTKEIEMKNATINELKSSLHEKSNLLEIINSNQDLLPRDWKEWSPASLTHKLNGNHNGGTNRQSSEDPGMTGEMEIVEDEEEEVLEEYQQYEAESSFPNPAPINSSPPPPSSFQPILNSGDPSTSDTNLQPEQHVDEQQDFDIPKESSPSLPTVASSSLSPLNNGGESQFLPPPPSIEEN